MSRLGISSVCSFFVCCVVNATLQAAERPLRQVIDRELKTVWEREKVTPTARTTDSQFLRRIFIDLTGTAPTYEQTTAFLSDKDSAKRDKLVDQLLADSRFAVAQANVWDQVLFGRHPGNADATRNRTGFKTWLAKQFADNVAYDTWVRELLLAEKAGSELFYVQFRGQPEEATVAVTKIFLGTQLQCARCHDHPFDQWTQKDFYGMTGFFVRLVVQENGSGNNRTFSIGEKNLGEVLFSGSAKEQTPGKKGDPVKPKFLGGTVLDEPPTPKDAKEVTPKNGTPLPKPTFSRKEKLAAWVVAKENPFFATATVNRVWAQFMGRGLVHPVDDFNAENKPSLPTLLKTMADEFVAHKYDLKWLIREIVSSNAYQLALQGPNRDALPQWFERARVRPLSAEEIMATMRQVTSYDIGLKPGEKLPNAGEEYFMRYFGEPTNGLGDFQGSLHEHLFLNNSEHVRSFARRKKGNLADTLLTSNDPVEKKVERLFLTVLQRTPTTKEQEAFTKYLQVKEKHDAFVEDAIWALLNSSEFRFNH